MTLDFYLKREAQVDELKCSIRSTDRKWICESKSQNKKRMQELIQKGAAILPPVSKLSILGGNNEMKEEQLFAYPHLKGNQLFCTLDDDFLKCINVSRQGNIV